MHIDHYFSYPIPLRMVLFGSSESRVAAFIPIKNFQQRCFPDDLGFEVAGERQTSGTLPFTGLNHSKGTRIGLPLFHI